MSELPPSRPGEEHFNLISALHKSLRESDVSHVIRNASTRLMKGVGYGDGYVYAHDFYEPTDRGVEARIAERMREFERLRQKARQH